MQGVRFAVIDIGTVTTRLLVADCSAERIRDVARRVTMTQLGAGMQPSGRLQRAAIERVGHTVESYLDIVRSCEDADGIERASTCVIAIATSAARDASNADELLARLEACGVALAIIPGAQEARLSFRGTTSAFPEAMRPLVVDIGGGSTEVSIGDTRSQAIELSRSFDIGCRRVTDRFLVDDPPSIEGIGRARTWIREEMAPFFQDVRALGPDRMLAVAGTATTMISMRDNMAVYDSKRVHRARLTCDEVRALSSRLSAMTLGERQQVIGLEPGRAGVIVAGTLVLEAVMELSGFEACSISESDLMQGVVLDAYDKMMQQS